MQQLIPVLLTGLVEIQTNAKPMVKPFPPPPFPNVNKKAHSHTLNFCSNKKTNQVNKTLTSIEKGDVDKGMTCMKQYH